MNKNKEWGKNVKERNLRKRKDSSRNKCLNLCNKNFKSRKTGDEAKRTNPKRRLKAKKQLKFRRRKLRRKW